LYQEKSGNPVTQPRKILRHFKQNLIKPIATRGEFDKSCVAPVKSFFLRKQMKQQKIKKSSRPNAQFSWPGCLASVARFFFMVQHTKTGKIISK
jgi:hypothetical protein